MAPEKRESNDGEEAERIICYSAAFGVNYIRWIEKYHKEDANYEKT